MHEFIVLASVEEVQLFNNQQFFNTATSLCTVPLSTFPMTFSIFIVNVISSFISVTIISFHGKLSPFMLKHSHSREDRIQWCFSRNLSNSQDWFRVIHADKLPGWRQNVGRAELLA